MPPPLPAGKVYLVGAGPGDPGLITLRGIQCLKSADVVLYDYLVNPVIVRHAPPNAKLICLGQHGGRQRIWDQAEINKRLVQLAGEGLNVVRLKGGDPAVFARGGEEAEYMRRSGIDVEIVPGITAALAAGSHAGIPITHRDLASAVALVTGREQPGKEPSLDYDALAKFPGTLVFYMGVTTAKHWSSLLISHGKPAHTPVAIVRRCSLPDQKIVRCRLDEVVPQLTPYSRMPPPVIVIVGEVTRPELAIDWFPSRPLFHQTVLVTRPAHQAQELAELFQAEGANVVFQPAIQISPVGDWTEVNRMVDRLEEFDCIVFSSINGVQVFLDRVLDQGRDVRALGSARLAAIGPATASALADYHLRADYVPDEYRAESLASLLANETDGDRYLIVRASRGRNVLAESLRSSGKSVEQVIVYDSVDTPELNPDIRELLTDRRIDWVTVTSSAIARSLAVLLAGEFSELRLASISPVTSATLRELGMEPAVEASRYTMEGIVEAVLQSQNDQ